MVLKPGVRGLYGRPCDKFNLTVVSDLYYLLASRWKIFLHITKLAVCLHTAKQLNNTVPSSRCVVVVSASWWIMNAVVFRGDHCLVEKCVCVCVFIFFIFFFSMCDSSSRKPGASLGPHGDRTPRGGSILLRVFWHPLRGQRGPLHPLPRRHEWNCQHSAAALSQIDHQSWRPTADHGLGPKYAPICVHVAKYGQCHHENRWHSFQSLEFLLHCRFLPKETVTMENCRKLKI